MGMILVHRIFMHMNRFLFFFLPLFSLPVLQGQICEKYHLVLKGETLYGIARNNACTVDQLTSANPNLTLPLKEGASLCIPVKSPASSNISDQANASSSFHTIELGESIYGLSKKYGCSIDSLYRLNPTLKETGLIQGQKIRVPSLAPEKSAPEPEFKEKRQAGVHKGKLKLALFAPFDESKPEYFEVALSFLEGVQLAISDWSDSLKMGVSLSVYNEFDAFSGFANGKPSVVFGPFLTQNYTRISPKIINQNIPILSPFSKQWEPKSQTEFKVSLTEPEAWATYIAGFHAENPGNSIFLSKAAAGKDSILRAQVAIELKKRGIPFLTCEATGAGIAAQSSTGSESLVALFVSSELRVRNILTGLTRSAVNPRNVQLLVPDEWLNFQVMEVGYYQKFNIHILAPSHFLEYPIFQSLWAERYKLFFNAWPDSYAEMGYLLTTFLFRKSMALENGGWVESIKSPEGDSPDLRFNFYSKTPSETGGINRRVRIIGFDQGQAVYKTATE